MSSGSGSWGSTCTTTGGSTPIENCNYTGSTISSGMVDRATVAGFGIALVIGGAVMVGGARGRDRTATAAGQQWATPPAAPRP